MTPSTLQIEGQSLALDDDGHLLELSQWNEAAAEGLAEQEGISLDERHWELIELVREFYASFEISPEMRPLVKYVRARLGKDKGRSIYLMLLFPPSPARVASKIAGLPRPENCL